MNTTSTFHGSAHGPNPRRQPYGSISAISTTLQTPAQAGMPPEWIHITSPVTDLHIDRLTSSRMELTYTAPAAVYTYRLRKVNR